MAYCHFELCRDCGLCFIELLLANIWRLSVLAVVFLYQITVFLQQNTTTSLLELYFNDSSLSANCVRARRRQSTKRGRQWGRCSIYRHQGPGTPASSSMCSGLMTVVAVSTLVERIGWSFQWLHGWSVHSIVWCRSRVSMQCDCGWPIHETPHRPHRRQMQVLFIGKMCLVQCILLISIKKKNRLRFSCISDLHFCYFCCLFSVRYRCIWGRCGWCGVSWHPQMTNRLGIPEVDSHELVCSTCQLPASTHPTPPGHPRRD